MHRLAVYAWAYCIALPFHFLGHNSANGIGWSGSPNCCGRRRLNTAETIAEGSFGPQIPTLEQFVGQPNHGGIDRKRCRGHIVGLGHTLNRPRLRPALASASIFSRQSLRFQFLLSSFCLRKASIEETNSATLRAAERAFRFGGRPTSTTIRLFGSALCWSRFIKPERFKPPPQRGKA